MGNKLYVGNLPYSFRDEDLQQAFAAHGTVTSAKVMMERDTGRSRGFAFERLASFTPRPGPRCRLKRRPPRGRRRCASTAPTATPAPLR